MVSIKKVECPKDKYSIKCPNTMNPEFIVIHNTYNDASAANEIAYMHRNNNKKSFHYAVDDKEIIQGIDLNRNSWNAGDGSNGKGNRKGISIEICYSKSGGDRFVKAEQNAAELTAKLLKDYGWGIDKVTKHQDYSGKYCPHRTLDNGWDKFLDLVKGYMTPATAGAVKEGDLVSIKSGAKYYDGKSVPSWVVAQKWYVVSVKGDRAVINKSENGKSAINSPINVMYLTVAKASAVAVKTISVGSTVKVKLNAKDLNTGKKLVLWTYARKYQVQSIKGNRVVLTYGGKVYAAIDIKDLTLV